MNLYEINCGIRRVDKILRRIPAKIILSMKLTVVLMLAVTLQISARTHAQQVTLSQKNVSLEQVFKSIQAQTGYGFFYEQGLLKSIPLVNVQVSKVSLKRALDACLEDLPLTYSIVGKTVVVKKKIEPLSKVFPKIETAPILQLLEIKGRVLNSDGEPLEGVSVILVGGKIGATTNYNGFFTINIAGATSGTLEFSRVGYQTKRVKVHNQTEINIVLEQDISGLDDLIVIGYGTSTVKDMTGSVSRLSATDMEGAPPQADIAAMLQGRAAGVNVMINNGAPGAAVAVQIRGTTSLTGNNQPLWVIDGIPQYNVNGSDIESVLKDFNVSDVESIDILKDASATAIYGSRAANGVILVTTKKGKVNMKPQIDISYNLGVQTQSDKYRMLSTEEFKKVTIDGLRNYFYSGSGTVPATGALAPFYDGTKVYTGMEVDYLSAPIESSPFFDANTDWWKELTQNALENKFDVSVRGGTPMSTYYMSVGLKDQAGIIKGSDQKILMIRMNFDTKVAEKLKVGTQINGSYTTTNNKNDMVSRIWAYRPDLPMYDEDGKPFDPGYNYENPLITLKNRNLSDRKGFNGLGFLEFTPLKNLLLRSSVATSFNISNTDRFQREGTVNSTHKGQANYTNSETSNFVFENTATYSKNFNKRHSLTTLVGFTMEKGVYKSVSVGVQNFPDQDVMTNLSSGTTPLKPTSTFTSNSLVSMFSRLNYKFQDRFLATFTYRMDGSSRFGPDKRWGNFPSGALAWLISNEKFAKNYLSFFNYLKLRVSGGISGSQVLGNNDWQPLFTATQYLEEPGITPSQMGNVDLQWEQTNSADVGIDYAILDSRLKGTIGTYLRDINNIIYMKGIPASSAFTSIRQNIASIRNTGIEFDFSYDLIRTKNTTFSVDFNIARNIAVCKEINGVDSVISLAAGTLNTMQLKEGEPIQQWIGYRWSGRYYQSMEEYNLLSTQNPLNGAKIWYQVSTTTIRPGDLRFEDVNGDGVVNNNDRVSLGTAQPKFFGGFGSSLRWKGFSLRANFSYSYGAKRYWYGNSQNWYVSGLTLRNFPAYVLDSWSEDNRDAIWPRMSFGQGSSNTFSDFWLSRADFVRLNLLNLSYRLPKRILPFNMLSSMDIAFSASNIFTITNYKGIDPQGNFNLSSGGIMGTGADFGTYPAMKSYNITLRASIK